MTTKPQYKIKGYYFGENTNTKENEDTHYYYTGSNSMRDHQRMWYNEAQKLGYLGGDLDSAETVKANYSGELTQNELIAIINDGELMDTPFTKLFPEELDQYLMVLRSTEQD